VVFCGCRILGGVALFGLMTVVCAGAVAIAAEDAAKGNATDTKTKDAKIVKASKDANKAEKQKQSKQPLKKKAAVGNPLAPWLVNQMVREINNGLKDRGIADRFADFESYTAWELDSTAIDKPQTSEMTGNCRLSWYDHLMRKPLKAVVEAEQFTRELHEAMLDDNMDRVLAIAREKMDAGHRKPLTLPEAKSPEQALEILKQSLIKAQTAYAAAMAPLSHEEVEYLRQYLYPVLTEQVTIGHTVWDRATGRRLCDLLEKMDRRALFDAADALVPLSDPRFLAQLAKIPDPKPSDKSDIKVEGVRGTVLQVINTQAGKIVIGGRGNNVYELDKMTDVCAVIDLGGDDVYYEGTVSPTRPVLVVIDLAGNDRYEGTQPGIQGGAVLGVSMLIDVAGDDVYEAKDIAQGSAVGGVGILIDRAGNDRYRGLRRVQGSALAGVGILLDRSGKDDYHAAMWAQGFGGPLGFGLLDDLDDNDHYYCGGMWRTSYYPETPGYEGWCQGVGAGLRGVAGGGIGVILDGGGDDVYEYDYFAQGGGYWPGAGFARDFGGNDRRLGGTQKEYDGSPRVQPMFDRFTCGFGCHYSIGFCFDDNGNDTYGGTIMGLGFAWDCSNGFLCDFGGNDHYEATGGLTEGVGAQAGLGVLFDYRGDDTYDGGYQGYASPGISYHSLPRCGGNFSFLIDYGGNDTYGCGADGDCYLTRGCDGGFLIHRPLQEEVDAQKALEAAKIKQAKKEP
jgi:hypothetical protein